jgi:hypothetical protein
MARSLRRSRAADADNRKRSRIKAKDAALTPESLLAGKKNEPGTSAQSSGKEKFSRANEHGGDEIFPMGFIPDS